MAVTDEVILVQRAVAGDETATRTLLEGLRAPLSQLADSCAATGLAEWDVIETMAAAISGALASFDGAWGVTFTEHASRSIRRALDELMSRRPAAPLN
ncbi:MAG: hypothetical protein JWN44_6845 [Myxococcales bacterium]|nr:hypothetical protein [Myxococcales bacterium]